MRRVLQGAAFSAALCARAPAGASPHGVFIDVETEQDLYDAVAARHFGAETFERLRALLSRGLSLDTATREELYELPNLTYAQVDAILAARASGEPLGAGERLVTAGVLSQRELDAIAPFLGGPSGEATAGASSGAERETTWRGPLAVWGQVATRFGSADRQVPSLAARVRGAMGPEASASVALALTRRRLGTVRHDRNRGALVAEAPRPRLELAKAFFEWRGERWRAIAGSYRTGFGLRATFDDGGAEGPGGAVPDDELAVLGGWARACVEVDGEAPAACDGDAVVTPDVAWREGRWGAALELSLPRLAAHVWASWSPRSVGQYEVGDARACVDLSREDLAACAAPALFREPAGQLLDPTTRLSAQRLPGVFIERLVGAHVAAVRDRRTRLGATGYAAALLSTIAGTSLVPRPWSQWPGVGSFGAVGVTVARGEGSWDYAAEVTRSFDHAPRRGHAASGGDLAAVARAVWARVGSELQLDVRYYGPGFTNPYARSPAAADEVQGQRARDEAGGRARYSSSTARTSLRLEGDLWTAVTRTTPALALQARGQRLFGARWSFGGALRYGQALAPDGACADSQCAPRVGSTVEVSRLHPAHELALTATWDGRELGARGAGHVVAAWLVARVRRPGGSGLRLHVRWRTEGLGSAASSSAAHAAIEAHLPLRAADLLRLRLDASIEEISASSHWGGAPRASLWISYDLAY